MNGHEKQRAEKSSWKVPDAFSRPLVVGLFLLVGLVMVLLFRYQSQRTQRDSDGAEPPVRQIQSEPAQKEDGHSASSDEQTTVQSTSPFRVHRSEKGDYTFYLDDPLDGIEPGARVSVSLHWQDQSFDRYKKQLMVQPEEGIKVEWSPAGPRKQIPPGVYRIRISGSNMLRTPMILSRLPEYLSDQEQTHAEMLMQSDKQALEYAVSVGSAKEVWTFHNEMLCELKRRGRSLVSAWKNWLKVARSSYDEDRDPGNISQELFDRFMAVRDAVQNVRGWIEEQEERYALLPYRNLRGELLKLSYVLSKKVNALSMTVLRQVGISPLSWPGAFVRRGFGSNINVLRYMSQYDQEAIRDVTTAIDNARMDLSYYDLQSYALDRLTSLIQYIDQFQKLNAHPYRQIIQFHLTEDGAKGNHLFRSVKRYVDDVVRIRKKGLRQIMPELNPASVRESYENVLTLLPSYSTSVFQKLARSLDVNRSGNSGMKPSSERSVKSVRDRIDQHLKGIRSRERPVPVDEGTCE